MTNETNAELNGFAKLGISGQLLKATNTAGFTEPKPIQEQAIPAQLAGRDILGIAQTGSGKTAAFALPILSRIIALGTKRRPKTARALILAPTRELAVQIEETIKVLEKGAHISTALVLGGVSRFSQVKKIGPGVDFLIATPGRLMDLVREKDVILSETTWLVLDEADRMLDMGFINDIRKIVAKLPIRRQTLFFSATMPKDIAELAEAMLRDPARVAVTPVASTVDRIAQRAIQVDFAAKPAVLAQLLKQEPVNRALVFTRTKHGADKVVKSLAKAGIEANAIHGNKSQNHRERTLAAFRSGEIRTLVATDIAARGIDVDGVSHVVNFDLPNIPETYVHRIGRTARAGADGVAISLIAGAEEMGYLRDIERLIRITVPREDRRTQGGREAAAPAQATHPHRGGRSAPRAHNVRGNEAAPGAKGPRRRRRPGGNKGAPQTSRGESPRPSQAGNSEGIQGVAFLHRESRPNPQHNRNNRPKH